MARRKANELQPHVKLLVYLQEGNFVSKDDILSKLSTDIHTYRLSTYIYDIKKYTPGVVKVTKNGKSVLGYQITNPVEVKKFLSTQNGLADYVPGAGTLKPSASKFASKTLTSLAGLNATPVKATKPAKVATKPAKVAKPAKVEDVLEVTEITD